MGSWALRIDGHGIHDNKKPDDVDAIARRLVSELRQAGHTIEHASLVVGSGRVLHEVDSPAPEGAFPAERLF